MFMSLMVEDFKPHYDPCISCPQRATHHLNMGFRVSLCDNHYETFMSLDLDND